MDRKRAKRTSEKLVEPQGSRVSRRNIIVLSGVLVLAGLAGADLHSLNLFGVKPTGNWGVTVLGVAAVLAQIYWYVLRYQHLSEDGTIERDPVRGVRGAKLAKISLNTALPLVRKEADLFSNWVAFLLTALSWYFIYSWIIDGAFA
ncbi:MAG: hypothetical protein OXM59_01105 [Gammaproteobacteria bacterium]|nr:hypothetical protein [Gammaproteobacteria bacterium]